MKRMDKTYKTKTQESANKNHPKKLLRNLQNKKLMKITKCVIQMKYKFSR